MATGKSGTLVWESGSFAIRVNWEETYDVGKNTSNVKITSLDLKSTSYYSTTYYPDGIVKINGTTVLTMKSTTPTGSCYVAEKNTWYKISNTACSLSDIAHNSDGSKSISIELTGNRYSEFSIFTGSGGSGNGWGVSSSKSITLTTIPRASTITSAYGVVLGNTCGVKWTPLSKSFHYRLKFSLGSWSHTTSAISPGSTAVYTYTGYTIPLSVCKQITSSTTGTMTVYLYTYSDEECTKRIGAINSKTFTVTVPESVKPAVSSAAITLDNSSNSVVKGWGVGVAGFSKVKVTASATPQYDSPIASFTVGGAYSTTKTGSSLDYTGGVLTSGNKTFTVIAKDKRGRASDSVTAGTLTVYGYSKPSLSSFSVQRSQANAKKIIVKADWTYSSVNGNNVITPTIYYKKSSSESWSTYNGTISKGVSTTLTTDFEETSSYDIKLVITDSLSGEASSIKSVSTISVLLDFKAGGKGLGIGKIVESDNLLDVAFKAKFNNVASFKGINFLDVDGNEKPGIQVIDGDEYGIGLNISSKGLIVIGGGESSTNFLKTDTTLSGSNERVFITSDTNVDFVVNCANIDERKRLIIANTGNIRPADASNSFSLGTASYKFNNGYFSNVYNSSGAITTSDARLKKDFTELPDVEEFVMSLKPTQYKYVDGTSGRNHWGFIAQDVKESLDNLNVDCGLYIENVIDDDSGEIKPLSECSYEEKELGLRYEELIAPIVALLQKQQLDINQLKEKLNVF